MQKTCRGHLADRQKSVDMQVANIERIRGKAGDWQGSGRWQAKGRQWSGWWQARSRPWSCRRQAWAGSVHISGRHGQAMVMQEAGMGRQWLCR